MRIYLRSKEVGEGEDRHFTPEFIDASKNFDLHDELTAKGFKGPLDTEFDGLYVTLGRRKLRFDSKTGLLVSEK